MSDTVRVNGVQIGWPSISLKINGQAYTGLSAIEFGDKRERGFAYGMGRHGGPRGRPPGKYTPDPFSITAWTSTAAAIRKDIAARASDGVSYGNVVCQIILQYVEQTDGTVTVEAQDCTLGEISASNEEGPDATNEKLVFQPMRIIRNGLTLFDSSVPGSGA